MSKGRLLKICADPNCKIHFGDRQREEKQRLQWKAEKTAANQRTKQTLAFRHRLLADVLKRVKSQFGTEELRMVAQFVLRSLSHELACRLAKRHGDTRLCTLRSAGVRPEALLGLLAWSCGWLERPQPVTAQELLSRFRLDSFPREPFVLTPELLREIGYS